MGWADWAIEKLKQDREVKIRPKGRSMQPKVESGAEVTLAPAKETELQKGDIVLCNVGKRQYLHLIKAVKEERYQIGNNKGGVNGWIGFDQIHGIAIEINNGKKK